MNSIRFHKYVGAELSSALGKIPQHCHVTYTTCVQCHIVLFFPIFRCMTQTAGEYWYGCCSLTLVRRQQDEEIWGKKTMQNVHFKYFFFKKNRQVARNKDFFQF